MKRSSEWVDLTLRFAGIVNIVWGLIFALFTNPLFRWAQLPEPAYLFPWQLIGIMAVIFGLGYYIASFNVTKNALVVMIGFAVKVVSTLAVWKSVFTRDFSLPLALYFSAKDLLWLVPFAMVVYHIFKKWQAPEKGRTNPSVPFAETLLSFRTDQGKNLLELSHAQPILLVFLPHDASPLFQQCADTIREQRSDIERQGAQLILVGPSRSERTMSILRSSGLVDEEYISDPTYVMYNTFNLKRATLGQIFGFQSWKQGWANTGLNGVNVDELIGDGFRMPGAFLVYRGELRKSYHYERSTDHPDFALLAEQ